MTIDISRAYMDAIEAIGRAYMDTIEAIERRAADSFVGPPKAFFEVLSHRCIYESIVYVAPTPEEALKAIEHIVIAEMLKRDGHGTHEGVRFPVDDGRTGQVLVWRMPGKVEVGGRGGHWKARTRVGYLPARAKP